MSFFETQLLITELDYIGAEESGTQETPWIQRRPGCRLTGAGLIAKVTVQELRVQAPGGTRHA